MNLSENLKCNTCQSILFQPVTLNCGHSICKKHYIFFSVLELISNKFNSASASGWGIRRFSTLEVSFLILELFTFYCIEYINSFLHYQLIQVLVKSSKWLL